MLARVLLVAWIMGLLAACAPVAARPVAHEAQETILFLISGDPADEAAYRTLVDAFMAADPTVQVDLLNIPSGGDFRRRLAADFAAGAPPDIFLINYRRYGPYLAAGAIEPVEPYLAHSAQLAREDFYPQALDAFTWQGALQCLPQNMSSPVIYYNRDLFAAAGLDDPAADWTWADFLAAAQVLTRDLDGDGAIDQYGLGIEPALVRAAPFIWMNDGEIVDDPAAPTRLTLDSAASRAALQWFVELQTVHGVVPNAVAEAAESSESRFLNSRLAMLMESRRTTPEFRAIDGFDWDVAPLPQGKQRASILHADAYCMAAAGRHQDAAWRFIEFANTRAGQSLLARTGRTVPSRIDLATTEVFLDPQARPANSRAFVDAIPAVRAFPAMTTWFDIESEIDAELEQAFYGQLSLDEAIRNAEARSAEFFQ
ncbi:sugar ABC transporter substrate-binding protein [Caldilinea sp.]|uniref:ABC transporter substrate-binding protein n=1 Tax=Caldilinea sp. TaxID=2293560 RepID=UPI002C0E2981|nr:sugar ABC transporter substrate-binding protein [Caldilinea sp.]HRA64732.1 sugar ABC transporter substrate-binding protein [Caldilinea sp.]